MTIAAPMFRYAVRYRRRDNATRIYRVTVTARNADDARLEAAMSDPLFASTVRTPKRGGQVLPPSDQP